jgi:hypothetical protein
MRKVAIDMFASCMSVALGAVYTRALSLSRFAHAKRIQAAHCVTFALDGFPTTPGPTAFSGPWYAWKMYLEPAMRRTHNITLMHHYR